MIDLILSEPASIDLDEIFDYSYKHFGPAKAVEYHEELISCFNSLLKFSNLGSARDEVRIGLRSIRCNSHVVYYRLKKERIFIVRILHHARDTERHIGN